MQMIHDLLSKLLLLPHLFPFVTALGAQINFQKQTLIFQENRSLTSNKTLTCVIITLIHSYRLKKRWYITTVISFTLYCSLLNPWWEHYILRTRMRLGPDRNHSTLSRLEIADSLICISRYAISRNCLSCAASYFNSLNHLCRRSLSLSACLPVLHSQQNQQQSI